MRTSPKRSGLPSGWGQPRRCDREPEDIFGDGVNIAARLEALAEPGGLCISRTVYDQVGERSSYPFEDIGEQMVKNIARPVRAYRVSAAAVASLPLVPSTPKNGKPATPSMAPNAKW
jgi:adenylate cyclase